MKVILQFDPKDIAEVYGYSSEELTLLPSHKVGYLMGKQLKCNKAFMANDINSFRCYLDLENQRNFDRIVARYTSRGV